MTDHSSGLYHYQLRKRKSGKQQDKIKKVFDKLIYIAVILGPVMNIPQLLKIWVNKIATGVSFISWISFSIISVFWFIYGVLHKEKPIIIMNLALMFLQVFIAVGALIYG